VRRRQFITEPSRRAAWPLAARVQQMLPTLGLSDRGTVSAQWISAFLQRWRQLGWIKNRTVAIEYRWAEGCVERYTEIAVDFVPLKVEVIVTTAGAVGAVSIFAVANDPIAGSTWRIFK
jgi:putative ABC transport system substrate-binding protein